MRSEIVLGGQRALPGLDAELADLAQHVVIEVRRAAASVLRVGELLARGHHLLGGGETFDRWASASCGLSRSSARRFLAVHERMAAFVSAAGADRFEASALYLLSEQRVTDEVRAAAAELAGNGETITRERARQLVAQQPAALEPEQLLIPGAEPPPSQRGTGEVFRSSASVEWWTPPEIVSMARACLDVDEPDLDPASCAAANEVVRAKRFFTTDIGGLTQEWGAKRRKTRVFLNPPSDMDRWVQKAIEEATLRRCLVWLLAFRVDTSTEWWQLLWWYPIAFFRERISFRSPSGESTGAPHASAAVLIGGDDEDRARFYEVMGEECHVVMPSGREASE